MKEPLLGRPSDSMPLLTLVDDREIEPGDTGKVFVLLEDRTRATSIAGEVVDFLDLGQEDHSVVQTGLESCEAGGRAKGSAVARHEV